MKVKVEYTYCDEYTGCDPDWCMMDLPADIDISDKEALLKWLDDEFPAEGTNSDGLDCNYIDPTIILDGKVICKRDDGDLGCMYEGTKINENTKITLTMGQLKALVKESVVNEARCPQCWANLDDEPMRKDRKGCKYKICPDCGERIDYESESGDDEGTFDDNAKLLQKEIEKVIASKCKAWEENGARLPFGMERNLARAIVEHLYLDWDCKPINGNVPNHESPRLDESTRGNKRGNKRPNRTKSRGNRQP